MGITVRKFARHAALVLLFAAIAVPASHAQTAPSGGGDESVATKVIETIVDAAKTATPNPAGAVGIIFTPSSTAPASMSECNGTNNCTQGFPSNVPQQPQQQPK